MTVSLGLKPSAYTTQNELTFTSPPGFASCVPELDQEPDHETGLSVLCTGQSGIIREAELRLWQAVHSNDPIGQINM